MPDTVVLWVEQLVTKYWHPEKIDFTFGLGTVVGDLPNDPDNKSNNYIRAPIVKGVAAQDVEHHMKDNDDNNTNNRNSCETYKVD